MKVVDCQSFFIVEMWSVLDVTLASSAVPHTIDVSMSNHWALSCYNNEQKELLDASGLMLPIR